MVITKAWLEANGTSGCGWTTGQLRLIGAFPPRRGWKHRVIGQNVSDDVALAFERLRKGAGDDPRLSKRQARKLAKRQTHKMARRRVQNVSRVTHPAIVLRPTVTGDAFLQSYEWRSLRMRVLKKQGARCQCCGATAKDGVRIHVDHIKPRRLFPGLSLDETNLQVLCEVCNHGKGNWDQTDWRGDEPIDRAVHAKPSEQKPRLVKRLALERREPDMHIAPFWHGHVSEASRR